MNADDRRLGRSRCHVVAVDRNEPSLRTGQALIEFAIVAFVLTLLLGGMLAYGLLLVSANVLQQAADVGAQELARHPYPADGTFDDALAPPSVSNPLGSGLFNESDLIIDPIPATDEALRNHVASLPLINRLLFPLYVFDPDHNVLRYPGAVVNHTDPATDETFRTVLIPTVRTTYNGIETEETINRWLHVVEEIDPCDTGEGPYKLTSANTGGLPSAGFVALRINYPYQSTAMVSYARVDRNTDAVLSSTEVINEDVDNVRVLADDSEDDRHEDLPENYEFALPASIDPRYDPSVSRGRFGLGAVGALGTAVRPFRKVLSAQGIYRREVLLP